MWMINMKKWLLVTTTHPKWIKIHQDDVIDFEAPHRCNTGDLVLLYQKSPINTFSYLFLVKSSENFYKGNYHITLHKKIKIKNPVSLSDAKKEGINLTGRTKFKEGSYELTEEEFAEFLKLIIHHNPDIFPGKPSVPCVGPSQETVHDPEELLNFIHYAKRYNSRYLNEEETKYLIILPLLRRMGWDTHNLKQVFPEHPADGEKVDYALQDHQGNMLFIEAKKLGEELDDYEYQIRNYFVRQGVNNAVLTNGQEWILYDAHFWDYGKGLLKRIDKQKIDLFQDPEKAAKILSNFFMETFKISTNSKAPLLSDILKKIKKIPVENPHNCYNEAAVKQVLLLPLLCSLGWDIKDETQIAFSPVLRYNGGNFRPDYILKSDNEPLVIFETRRMGTDLRNDDYGKIFNITLENKAPMGVLTDSKQWFFILTKGKTYYGLYEHHVDSSSFEESLNLFKNLLSRISVENRDNVKYLETMV